MTAARIGHNGDGGAEQNMQLQARHPAEAGFRACKHGDISQCAYCSAYAQASALLQGLRASTSPNSQVAQPLHGLFKLQQYMLSVSNLLGLGHLWLQKPFSGA